MLIDHVVHGYHESAQGCHDIALTEPDPKKRVDLELHAEYEQKVAREINVSVRYWLDVRELERLKGARFKGLAFPPVIHDGIFIEFNGRLTFGFRPWARPDVLIADSKTKVRAPLQEIAPRAFTNDLPTTEYRGVYIRRYVPPHHYVDWPEEPVVRVTWFETPRSVLDRQTGKTYPCLDNYSASFTQSSWPNRFDPYKILDNDELVHSGEREHGERLFRTAVNLLYFLAAENVVRVRIRPEMRRGPRARELKGLPKSDRPYYVTPFQLPRYKYLHRSAPTGARVSVCFDVRGFFRTLTNDRYGKNEDGTCRVIWVAPHRRGLGNPYRPQVRRGAIDSLFLDYDKFIAGEERRAREGARRAKPN